jgi:hypothetical protein
MNALDRLNARKAMGGVVGGRRRAQTLSPERRQEIARKAAEARHRKLAEAKINVTAIDAVCAGAGRYGAILWVAPRDVSKAAKLLGAA